MADSNIALNRPATASGYVMPYAPSMAVNGTITSFSRWLCNTVPATLTVDLGSVNIITSWVVKHMSVAGWASPDYNMTDYALQGSNNNTNWVTIDSVAGNTASTTARNVLSAYRYVRVYVTRGLRTNPQMASLMEFEVYGHLPTANLSALSISSGALTPAFTPLTLAYTTPNVPYGTSSVTVTPTVQDPSSIVKINGTVVASGQGSPVNLNVGSNIINVLVTAIDGVTTKAYTITVIREQGAVLSNLTISSGTLNPAFASNILAYTTGNVAYDTAVTVTPTTTIAGTTITVNGTPATSGQPAAVNLNVGSNTISIVVTNGAASQTYTITVVRCSPYLSGLSISSGAFNETFSKNLYAYTATVVNTVTSVTVTPIAEDATATITVNTIPVASGSASPAIPLNEGPNTITVIVTPGVGTVQTYTITVTRARLVYLNNIVVTCTDATAILNPVFNSNILNYDYKVVSGVTSVKITPSVPAGSTVTVNNGPLTGTFKIVTLTPLPMAIPVKVSKAGVDTTYIITVKN